MATTTTTLRLRSSAAQLEALARVERHIRAADLIQDCEYIREFSEAFPSYHSVMTRQQLRRAFRDADILLVGDYHALASCQQFCARLVREQASSGNRPMVLGVEAIFARDQHILDAWQRGEIDQNTLRARIRYDLDWQYDWAPFYELLVTARDSGAAIYGLDRTSRDNLQRIALRDRHAARKISELRARHAGSQIVVLFGESHLAPSHLPAQLRSLLPQERVLMVLQNLDQLYWKTRAERRAPVEAVRLAYDVFCVFNATPLEKYESYRLYLERWGLVPPLKEF